MRIDSPITSLNRRSPLKSVPLQKRRKSSEDFFKTAIPLAANGLFEGNVLKKKETGKPDGDVDDWLHKKPLIIDTAFADEQKPSTSGERDHLIDSDYASLSVTPAASDQVDESVPIEVQCCVWDWRTTHIGAFMKKNRIISLKHRMDALNIQKPLPTYDADIGKLPAQKPLKRSKYNPYQETFVTDVSHRSRRCATFRKRRFTRLDGPISDAMLQKVQVPVEAAYSEPKVEHYADIGSTTLNEDVLKSVLSAEELQILQQDAQIAAPISSDLTIRITRLPDRVSDFLLTAEDGKFWKELNWQLWTDRRGPEALRDENNRQLALPPAGILRKEDFVYVLSLLETICFNEIHTMLLDVLNVHNQAEGDGAFCEICQSDVSDRNDPIVFCEGCELPVHQNCYAFTDLPKKAWYCNVCTALGPKAQARCRFCPLSWGTMKQTVEGGWAHFACAVWQQSLRFENLTTFEPISHEWDLNTESFTKTCSVCDLCYGPCISCSVPSCRIPFHATCGLRSGLYMFIEDSAKSKIGVKLFSFCAYHSEKARRGCEGNRMDLVLQQLNTATTNPGVECYKKSRICKMESSFDRFVNWKRLATEINLPKPVMKGVFSYWVKRRRAAGNRPLVQLTEANEIFITNRFREEAARNAMLKRSPQAEIPEEDLDEINSDYTKSHCILDKFRNLATLSVRRERMKLQVVKLLKEAFEETTSYMQEDSHLTERFMLKVANFFNEHLHGTGSGNILEYSRGSSTISEDTNCVQYLEPSTSRKRHRTSTEFVAPKLRRTAEFSCPRSKIHDIFADLFDQVPELSEQLFNALPKNCL